MMTEKMEMRRMSRRLGVAIMRTQAGLILGGLASALAVAAPVDTPLRFSGKVDGKVETWSFPYLVDPDNAQAVARINAYLHIAELQAAPPGKPPTSVQPVEGEDAMPLELISEGVKLLNQGRVIEVGYWHREKGIAYGEHRKIQFDTRNGAVVWQEHILTPAGTKALAARVLKARAANLDREERKLESDAKKTGRGRAEIDQAIAIFDYWRAACLEDKNSSGWSSPGVVRIVENGLHIEATSCSGGGIDRLAPFDMQLTAKDVAPYLTAYGKYLVTGQGDGVPPSALPLGEVLHGTVNGNLGVTMYLDRYEVNGHVSGRYYYDKHRQFIPLEGRLTGKDTVDLQEGEPTAARRPVFHLQMKGGRLLGKWQDGKKTFDVELNP